MEVDKTATGHKDVNRDHVCDNGCGIAQGVCKDSATDTDHVCDYGCKKVLESCSGGTATCVAQAICDVCGLPYGELGDHKYEWNDEVPASCTSEGTLGHYHCSNCDQNFDENYKVLESLVIDKVAHTPKEAVRENVHAETCYSQGSYEEVVRCDVCNAEIRREGKILPIKAHSPAPAVRENETDSTCYAEGSYEEVVYCLVSECPCSKDGTTEISRVTKTIEKKAHTPGIRQEDVVNSTCTTGGSYVLVTYCTVEECGEEISRETVTTNPLDHSFTDYKSNGDATCTEDGTMTAKCDRCDVTNTITDEGSAGHPSEISEVIPPSCENDGYTEYRCTVCHEVLRTEWGEKATGHTDGKDNVWDNLCDTCGEEICKHDWDISYEWEIDLSDLENPIVICHATGICKTEGGCGRTQTATANVLGETIITDADTAKYPTCEDDGFVTFYAVFADSWLKPEEGKWNASEDVTIPKTGHDLTQVEAKAPTCTASGYEA